MKNVNLSSSILISGILLASFLSSCTKTDSANYIPLEATAPTNELRAEVNAVYYDLVFDSDGEICCPWIGIGCLCGDDDIVIEADKDVFETIFNSVYDGNPNTISSLFSTNRAIMTKYIQPFYIDGVISHELSITAHENTKNNLKFLFFEDDEGKKMTYQLNVK